MKVQVFWWSTLLLASLACAGADTVAVPPPPLPPSPPPPSGSPRIEELGSFHSAILNNDRPIHVYLPAGYDGGTQRYPVLYVHDGADAFGRGGMNYDGTATTLIAKGTIRPIIIVAVDQINSQKDAEYSPTKNLLTGIGGRGPLYARALVEELKPMIDTRYRTLTGPDDTGVGGKSFGGLISWYFMLAQSAVFHRMFAESGSLTWDSSWTIKQVQNLPAKLPVRIWFDRGSNDGEPSSHAADVQMRAALLSKGWVEGSEFKFLLYPGGTHSEGSFAARVDQILLFLFPNS